MKFKQLSTGAVLEVKNEDVIAMMNASSAYTAIEQPSAETPAKNSKGKEKSVEDNKSAE